MSARDDQVTFNEGDIFYTEYDGQYHLYKLLRKDEDHDAWHVLSYVPMDDLPGKYGINDLEVKVYHFPIHREAFEGAQLLTQRSVTDDELIGYYEYMKKLEEDFEESANKATAYYQEAYILTDEGKLEEAIECYSKAIDLMPSFYEAIDNRAFCKMDLGRWRDAIEDFQLSLSVNPDSLLAEFSIGECYLALKEYQKAIEQFEKCRQLDPNHQATKDYLLKAKDQLDDSSSH